MPTAATLAERDVRATRQRAFRALHRLLSIASDAGALQELVTSLRQSYPFPLLPNQRAGGWYTPPAANVGAYFKSTDGHVNIHNFSEQRLNLPLFELASRSGGVFLVDTTKSSKKKSMPDSLSRTIPIWCAVVNSYHQKLSSPTAPSAPPVLFTPSSSVSPSEHLAMLARIRDEHVPSLVSKGDACISSSFLLSAFAKPLRCYWVTRAESGEEAFEDGERPDRDNFTCIVCISASRRIPKPPLWEESHQFFYSPGAGDDHEGWARGLTPEMFSAHRDEILKEPRTEDLVDERIDAVVARNPSDFVPAEREYDDSSYDQIGETCLSVQAKRAQRRAKRAQRRARRAQRRATRAQRRAKRAQRRARPLQHTIKATKAAADAGFRRDSRK
jgi:tRNA A64-2'-O-ribosylphosphate transferase